MVADILIWKCNVGIKFVLSGFGYWMEAPVNNKLNLKVNLEIKTDEGYDNTYCRR